MSSHDQVLTNARVFTATDESVIVGGAVWVSGNRIAYAGSQQGLPAVPAGCEVIDVEGGFVMPGMTETLPISRSPTPARSPSAARRWRKQPSLRSGTQR